MISEVLFHVSQRLQAQVISRLTCHHLSRLSVPDGNNLRRRQSHNSGFEELKQHIEEEQKQLKPDVLPTEEDSLLHFDDKQ